jgi:hypothetical protein
MPSYIVETYVPRARVHDAKAAGARVQAAADELSGEGTSIRYVRTTHVPEDEMCFHVVETSSAIDVDELCRRAELGHVRIVVAVET